MGPSRVNASCDYRFDASSFGRKPKCVAIIVQRRGTVGGGNSCRIRSKFTRLSFARTIALRGGEGRMQVSRMVGLVGGVGGKNGSSATPV